MNQDVAQIKTHLDSLIRSYAANGLSYGIADVVTPTDQEKDKMLVCLFITVLERLGCMPFSILKEEVVKAAPLVVNVETRGPPEVSIRTRIYFRIGEDFSEPEASEPASPAPDDALDS